MRQQFSRSDARTTNFWPRRRCSFLDHLFLLLFCLVSCLPLVLCTIVKSMKLIVHLPVAKMPGLKLNCTVGVTGPDDWNGLRVCPMPLRSISLNRNAGRRKNLGSAPCLPNTEPRSAFAPSLAAVPAILNRE